jgi:hypothetical protein
MFNLPVFQLLQLTFSCHKCRWFKQTIFQCDSLLEHLWRIAAERLNNFVVGLTNIPPNTTAPSMDNIVRCGTGPPQAEAGSRIVVGCSSGMWPARYVVILGLQPSMTLCEVEVFGISGSQLLMMMLMLVMMYLRECFALSSCDSSQYAVWKIQVGTSIIKHSSTNQPMDRSNNLLGITSLKAG